MMKLPAWLSKVKPVTFVTPVSFYSSGGIAVGENNEVWLWRVLESAALKFGSDDSRGPACRQASHDACGLGPHGPRPDDPRILSRL